MITTITRERLSFWVGDKEYVEIDIPDDLQQAVAAILEFTESYETPEQAALDAVLEAAFDSGDVEPEALVTLVKAWTEGEAVKVGELRSHDGIVYKAIQAHTTQDDWKPPDTPALWTVYNKTTEGGEIDDWVQPTGAHDAYNTGDRVRFEGAIYESLIDGNVWSPADYPAGWKLNEEE
jgi:hypothetical protein